MKADIPIEIAQAIERLRQEAAEKTRIANDLERHYSGGGVGLVSAWRRKTEARQSIDLPNPHSPLVNSVGQPPVPSAADIKRRLKERGARAKELAGHFFVSEEKIREIISTPGSGLTIASRGWVQEINH